MFANLENSRMFAVPKIIYSSVVSAFLCTANSVLANNTGYQIPCSNTALSYVMVFGETGGDSLSCIQSVTNKIHLQMPKTNEFVAPAKVSSRENTPSSATTVPTSFSACHNTAFAIVQGENNHLIFNIQLGEFFNEEFIRKLVSELFKEIVEKNNRSYH